jgi:predicted nucleic acid-binding Zn ribbon protein
MRGTRMPMGKPCRRGSSAQSAERPIPVVKEQKPSLTPLSDILAALLSDPSLPFRPEDHLIWKVWDEAVGPSVARNARPLWIRKGRLRVKVSDPIWLQELGLTEKTLREKLNERLGRQAVEKIEFRLTSR